MDQQSEENERIKEQEKGNSRKKSFMQQARLKPLFAETIKSTQGQPVTAENTITPSEWMAKTQLESNPTRISEEGPNRDSHGSSLEVPAAQTPTSRMQNTTMRPEDLQSTSSGTSSGPSIVAASQMLSHRTGDGDSDDSDSVLFDLRDEETRRIREVCFTRVSELFKDLADFLTVTKRHEYVILRKGAHDTDQVFENFNNFFFVKSIMQPRPEAGKTKCASTSAI